MCPRLITEFDRKVTKNISHLQASCLFFVHNEQKSLLFPALEAFAEGVGIDVPAEHKRELLAEVVEIMRVEVVTERLIVPTAIVDIVAHRRIFVRLRAAGRDCIGKEFLLHSRLTLLLGERIQCGGC